MTNITPITLAYGDGIGPEIMQAVRRILEAAKAQVHFDVVEIGKKAFLEGFTSGIPDSAWEIIKRNPVLLKAPITTPQGGGYKSLNVTLRKTLGLYANVRPCVTYRPYVTAHCEQMDLVIVRENEEDTYTGIEYQQTPDLVECLKLITKQGCERVIRFAFDYARKCGRKKVSCFSKDNIMKMTDGLFHRTFNEIATHYPEIEHDHYIVDIGTALLATDPGRFDVIVSLNLYGDILSDVAAQVAGSVGLAGSANIGKEFAMFEAIHGSAPDIAGKDIANPSGLLNAATQMLVHINQADVAMRIQNAWLKTIEEGIHTADIYSANSHEKVGTQAFADAVIARLGQSPAHFKPACYQCAAPVIPTEIVSQQPPVTVKKALVGVDLYVDNSERALPICMIVGLLEELVFALKLDSISYLGLKIWPNSPDEDAEPAHYCCRFVSAYGGHLPTITLQTITTLLNGCDLLNLDVIKIENLYSFDGERGFSLPQGQ